MSGVRQTWLVAAREMRERSRSPAFLISVVLMLMAVAAAIVLPAVLDTGPGTKDVGLTGDAPTGLAAAIRRQGQAVDTTNRIHRYPDVLSGEGAVRNGGIDVLVVDARRLEWRKRADEQLKAIATGAIQVVTIQARAAAAGIDPGSLAALITPVPVKSLELSRVVGRGADDEAAAFILTLILFGAISTYGAMVLSGVVEEKASRTIEVLLARIPARNLLAGKVVGIGLLGLGQIVATGAVALTAAALVDSVDLPAVRGTVVIWAVLFFLIGYALYATIFGTLGSLASRTEDASSVAGPVTIVLVLGFMVSFAAIGSAESTWARIVSWFPLTAPTAMPNRIAMGAATWWDPTVAVVLTVATIVGLVYVGGHIYTRAILHTGSTMKLGDAWHGTPRTGSAEARRADNPRFDRRVIVAMVMAVTTGAVAFALTGDLVISVGGAAAAYAISDRALKAWGRPSSPGGTRQPMGPPPRGGPSRVPRILIKSSSTQPSDPSSSSRGPSARDRGGRCADPDRELQP
jgi:ABC-2 type transport system permease protein